MPASHTRWTCNKCRRRFATFREAENCELDHIVKDTIGDFKDDLARIFEPKNISPKERSR